MIITIGFSTHKKFAILAWIIKKVQKTKYSHIYLKFNSDSLQRTLIYQASGLEVNFCGDSVFLSKNKIIEEFELYFDNKEHTILLQKCVDLAGTPYGIKELMGIGIVKAAKLLDKNIKNPFADGDKSFVCSELIGTLLNMLGYDFDNLDSLTPKDIYEKLRSASHGQTLPD